MNTRCNIGAFLTALPMVAAAQGEGMLTAGGTLPGETAPAEPVPAVVAEEPPAPRDTPQERALPRSEQLIRAGIIMLDQVQKTLSGINNAETAEAAVAPLMRTEAALQEWARTFNTLPPLAEEEQNAYEEVYLPIINKLNNRIRVQGERLASAEYYGSRNLPAALIRLALINR